MSYYYTLNKQLTFDALSPVWEELTASQNAILTITYGNTKKLIKPEQQFKNYFYNRVFIHYEFEILRIKFLMILNDETSYFLLQQIKRATDYLNQLSDLDNWSSETEYTSDNTFLSNTDGNTTNKSISRNANSDNNSNMEPDFIKEFLKLEEKDKQEKKEKEGIFIPANTLSINLNADSNVNSSENTGSNNTVSSTKVNNTSDDIIRFFRVEIPALRNRFWMRFECLFRD